MNEKCEQGFDNAIHADDRSCSHAGSRLAAAGPGVWALAVFLLISLISAAAFILFKFKKVWQLLQVFLFIKYNSFTFLKMLQF